jgi:hypothetical protein
MVSGTSLFETLAMCNDVVFAENDIGITGPKSDDPPMSRQKNVCMSTCCGCATIVLQHLDDLPRNRLIAVAFRAAVREFLLHGQMHTLFLWISGDHLHGDFLTSPNPPLPIWAKADTNVVEVDAHLEGGNSAHATFQEALELLQRLPQPVIGLADGIIDSYGTSILDVCDQVAATRATQFRPMLNDCELTRRRLRHMLQHLSITASKAKDIGFVTAVVDNTEALTQERTHLKTRFQQASPEARSMVKKKKKKRTQDWQDSLFFDPWPPTAYDDSVPLQLDAYHPWMHAAVIGADPECQPLQQWPASGLSMEQERIGLPQTGLWRGQTTQVFRGPDSTRNSGAAGIPSAYSASKHQQQPQRTAAKVERGGDSRESSKTVKDAKVLNCTNGTVAQKSPVPHRKDFASEYSSHEGPITSLMIRNLPCCITQCRLVEALDTLGFQGTYDFLHLPTGGRSAAMRANNLGYGFINFNNAHDAARFMDAFSGYIFEGTYSEKACVVRPAHIQGLNSNLRNLPQKRRSRGRCPVFVARDSPEEWSTESHQALRGLTVMDD